MPELKFVESLPEKRREQQNVSYVMTWIIGVHEIRLHRIHSWPCLHLQSYGQPRNPSKSTAPLSRTCKLKAEPLAADETRKVNTGSGSKYREKAEDGFTVPAIQPLNGCFDLETFGMRMHSLGIGRFKTAVDV